MDIQDLVLEKIKTSDYDGLFDSTGECACIGDMPCGEPNMECAFGYFYELTDEQKKEYEFMIGPKQKEEQKDVQ